MYVCDTVRPRYGIYQSAPLCADLSGGRLARLVHVLTMSSHNLQYSAGIGSSKGKSVLVWDYSQLAEM
jgi:hypothetical protein